MAFEIKYMYFFVPEANLKFPKFLSQISEKSNNYLNYCL